MQFLSFSMNERIVIVYGSHAQTQSLFLLLHDINNTAQACQTACTSEASSSRIIEAPATTLHTSLEAMPAVSVFFLASTLMASTTFKPKTHVRRERKKDRVGWGLRGGVGL